MCGNDFGFSVGNNSFVVAMASMSKYLAFGIRVVVYSCDGLRVWPVVGSGL